MIDSLSRAQPPSSAHPSTSVTPPSPKTKPDTIENIEPPQDSSEESNSCWTIVWELIVSLFESIAYLFKWMFGLLEDPDEKIKIMAAQRAADEAAAKIGMPPRKNGAEQALEKAFPIEEKHKEFADKIFLTLGTTTLFVLAGKQTELKNFGNQLSEIFPLKMLAWSLRTYTEREHINTIRNTFAIFSKYKADLGADLSKYFTEKDQEQFSYHMKGFCQYADLDPGLIFDAIKSAQKKKIDESEKKRFVSAFTKEADAKETDEMLETALKSLWDPLFASLGIKEWPEFCNTIFDLLIKKRDEADEKKSIEAFCNTLNATKLREFCRYPGANPEKLLEILEEINTEADVDGDNLLKLIAENNDQGAIEAAWAPLFDTLTKEQRASATSRIVEHLFVPKLPCYPFEGIETAPVNVFSVGVSDKAIHDLLSTYADKAILPTSHHTKKWKGVEHAHPLRLIEILFTHSDSAVHAKRIAQLTTILHDKSPLANKREHFFKQFSNHVCQPIEETHIVAFCERLSLKQDEVRPMIEEDNREGLITYLAAKKSLQAETNLSTLEPLRAAEELQVTELVKAYKEKPIAVSDALLRGLWAPVQHIHPFRLLIALCSDANKGTLKAAFYGGLAQISGNAKRHFLAQFTPFAKDVSNELVEELLAKLPLNDQKEQVKAAIEAKNWELLFKLILK